MGQLAARNSLSPQRSKLAPKRPTSHAHLAAIVEPKLAVDGWEVDIAGWAHKKRVDGKATTSTSSKRHRVKHKKRQRENEKKEKEQLIRGRTKQRAEEAAQEKERRRAPGSQMGQRAASQPASQREG
ncbi:hypothetical protein TRV_00790 [Trichophyton verrucosum HKI 0517]|uniref:Uncharacterized protein n=1 Tax=Trichophyton verrucosum (strain HKI 0517) TaxID=663202 RepID=D4D143_TRIVH|nr:uncharacterized protein TRV_00790 [Trichophyton verrucosum HKI 0517]EFE44441.1 hypothetical protein TRV_00790 [Trichophyton verrucosum HKI 0517]